MSANATPPSAVPPATRQVLERFRASHPVRHTTVGGARWEYLTGGDGRESLLILPGLIGVAEMSFQHVLALETSYHVVCPSYPFSAQSVAEIVAGVAGVLDADGVGRAHVLGGSYGGMVAQVFVRRYPDRVLNLVLSHTGGPKPGRGKSNQKVLAFFRWLPMSLMRSLLGGQTRRTLRDAPEQIPFWDAYSREMVAGLSKVDLLGRLAVAVDFDVSSKFSPDDLKGWPGRILILEGDNDPLAEAPEREALKNLHPQASVHTFHGSGHVASIAKADEYARVVAGFLSAA